VSQQRRHATKRVGDVDYELLVLRCVRTREDFLSKLRILCTIGLSSESAVTRLTAKAEFPRMWRQLKESTVEAVESVVLWRKCVLERYMIC
jgi:hypothetical protein